MSASEDATAIRRWLEQILIQLKQLNIALLRKG